MQQLKSHKYEGKNKEDLLNDSLKKLNASTDEVYYNYKEQLSGGLFKSKKYELTVVLKNEVLDYIKSYLKQITTLMGLEVNFETQKRETFIKVNMISNNNSILIGKNGKTMSCLQLLVRQAVQNQLGVRVNVILDVEEYKEKQQRNIERLAIKLAKDVVKTNIEVKMDSMNSFERRLVHNALTNFKGIKTESTGEEPNRCVVIKPLEK